MVLGHTSLSMLLQICASTVLSSKLSSWFRISRTRKRFIAFPLNAHHCRREGGKFKLIRRTPDKFPSRAVDNFYSLGGHNRSECQCGLNFIGMPCTYKPTCIHNLI